MTIYSWLNLSSDLGNVFNWGPQPPPPNPPLLPGPSDSVLFQKVGTPTYFDLTGSLSVASSEFVNCEFDLYGALTAGTTRVDSGALLMLTANGTAGSSLSGGFETVAGALTQAAGTNSANQLTVTGAYNLQASTLTVQGYEVIGGTSAGNFLQTGGSNASSGLLLFGLYQLNSGSYQVNNNAYAFVGYGGAGTVHPIGRLTDVLRRRPHRRLQCVELHKRPFSNQRRDAHVQRRVELWLNLRRRWRLRRTRLHRRPDHGRRRHLCRLQ